MTISWIDAFDSTKWKGVGELWLDPEGDVADRCECSMFFDDKILSYMWFYEGEIKQGHFEFFDAGATWTDNWHQPIPAKCMNVKNTGSLFAIEHSYSDPSEPSWRWRSLLSKRPDGNLILQMTNIAPWGEEGRAVRMIFEKQDGNV